MGIPAAFRHLSQKYPKIISPVIEEQPQEIDGVVIPIDTTGPNPNGEEMDNLYLDMNGIVHPCSHPEDKPAPSNEEEMMREVFKYTERVVNMVRPRKLLMIAVDGVAPRAKMNQQRSRRFRSAQEAKEKDEDNAEFLKMLKAKGNGTTHESIEESMKKKTWDSNAITPGTPFMDTLALSLRYWIAYKLNTDAGWAKLKVIISDATVPGEGEHKIMEFIRSQRSSPEHDPNTRHVIYGLDADLIMLGLATHEPHFRVLREDVFFQQTKARTCRICGQKGHKAEECRGAAKPKDGEFDEKDSAHPLKPFIWLHVHVLREYLEVELYVPNQPFPFDLERALDDWVFMCFFVGNDFLPHLPSLDIREDGIETLMAIWRDNIPVMGGYLTKDGHVDLDRAQIIMAGLAKQEDAIFRRRRQAEERREANTKRRKLDEQHRSNSGRSSTGGRRGSPDYGTPTNASRGRRVVTAAEPPPDLPLFAPGNVTKEARALTHDMVVNRGAMYKANQANKSAAAALKSQLLGGGPLTPSADATTAKDGDAPPEAEAGAEAEGDPPSQTPPVALGKRKAELMDDGNGTPGGNGSDSSGTPAVADGEPPPDDVRLWEVGYADRYYERKFHADPHDIEFRHRVARAYVEGLAWVLLYYFQGCPSWTWYYPYHYAPFAADFVDLGSMSLSFDQGVPFKPFEQLMGVMPAASRHTLPSAFHELMTSEDSEIIDFYPDDFPIDLNGKKFAWQGVALLPFIDEKRLLKAMHEKYPHLSAEDAARNEVGREVLLLSDAHPLYDEIASKFYSKKQGVPKYKLNPRISEGLAGKVEKNETVLPRSSLVSPLDESGLPDLEDDRSISVHYELPRSSHLHKSMLLRGIKPPPPALTRADIESTKGRARNAGRSYGGAPLNGSGRGGRGGPMNYSVSASASYARSGPPTGGNGYGGYGPPSWTPGAAPPPPGVPLSSSWPPPSYAGANGYGGYAPPPPPGAPGTGDFYSPSNQDYGSRAPPPAPYRNDRDHHGQGYNGRGPPPPPAGGAGRNPRNGGYDGYRR
ncbi:MAG: 5'-3' exoribonuclease 2 [Thelocarpon superellum]|nr:MAG: 5'-3' exoribonuclease 2 [Thelocarpon superellum]